MAYSQQKIKTKNKRKKKFKSKKKLIIRTYSSDSKFRFLVHIVAKAPNLAQMFFVPYHFDFIRAPNILTTRSAVNQNFSLANSKFNLDIFLSLKLAKFWSVALFIIFLGKNCLNVVLRSFVKAVAIFSSFWQKQRYFFSRIMS